MEYAVVFLANRLGVGVEELLAFFTCIVIVANLIGRAIPDSAEGWLGTVRKICKVVGLYLPNRLTPSVDASTVGKAIAATVNDETLRQASKCLPVAVKEGRPIGDVANEIARGATEYVGDAIAAGINAELEPVLDLVDKAGPFHLAAENLRNK